MSKFLGIVNVSGEQLDVVQTREGSLVAVGYVSQSEDWEIVAAVEAGSTPGRHQHDKIVAAARETAVKSGLLKITAVGLVANSSENITRYSEEWTGQQLENGVPVFQSGVHVFRMERKETKISIRGALHPVNVYHFDFVLLPSAVRNGKLVIY